ncbi:MAG TPA: hypothetical protein VK635_26660 [Bradyrhizobium sp.]|jgi:hypothetical protein|nr:hypothetical protein [Bradyrhizobium sp.]
MTTEPAGAYFANANNGFATGIRAGLMIESIFLTPTGFHTAGKCADAQHRQSRLREVPHATN